MSCSFVFILRVCARLLPTVLFLLSLCSRSSSKLRSSVLIVTVNDDSGAAISPSINQLIQSSVAESIGALTDNLWEVIEDRLGGSARQFLEENGSTVEQAVKTARRESYTCKRKGNQRQLDHAVQVLNRFDEASVALKGKPYNKVKDTLDAGSLSSASGQPNRRAFSSSQRLGPCFKISSFLYFSRETCFIFTFGFMALLSGHIQYSPGFAGFFVSCFSINFW